MPDSIAPAAWHPAGARAGQSAGRPARALAQAIQPLPEVVDACAVVPFPAVGGKVAPAVRSAAVGVGDTVSVGELARGEDRASPAARIICPGERGNPPGDVAG